MIDSSSAPDALTGWTPILSASRTVRPTVMSAARSLAASSLDPVISMYEKPAVINATAANPIVR